MKARMFAILLLVTVITSLFGIAAPAPASADALGGWSDDPAINLPLSTSPRNQQDSKIIRDDDGNYITAWRDYNNISVDTHDVKIFVQKLDAAGHYLWAENGVPATPVFISSNWDFDIASDGQGGVYVTWNCAYIDKNNDEDCADAVEQLNRDALYAQRLDADGVPQWVNLATLVVTPKLVTNIGSSIHDHSIISDGENGIIVHWNSMYLHPSTNCVCVQKMDLAGNRLWGSNGYALFDGYSGSRYGEFTGYYALTVPDGAGGAFLGFDFNVYSTNICYMETIHINNEGHRPAGEGTGTEGTRLGVIGWNSPADVKMIPSGDGGAILAWQAFFTTNHTDIYAQKVNSDNDIVWGDGGVGVCTAAGAQGKVVGAVSRGMDAATDGAGGAYISWEDEDYKVYGQRLNDLGVPQWALNGIVLALTHTGSEETEPRIEPDGTGGAIISWVNRTGLYAQHFSSDSTRQWETDVRMSTHCFIENSHETVADGHGGMVAAWHDGRNGASDIFAQNINVDGDIGFIPVPMGVIAFSSMRDGHSQIYIMNCDGTSQTNLSRNGNTETLPSISRDGSKIAYVSQVGGKDQIFTMNADGTAQSRLMTSDTDDSYPCWSPAGDKIAFIRGNDIYTVDADGSDVFQISDFHEITIGMLSYLTWSPVGDKIAFQRSVGDSSSICYITDTTVLNLGYLSFGDGTYNNHPEYSWSGEKIAYSSYYTFTSAFDLYIINADGSGSPFTLSDAKGPPKTAPTWSPDDYFLAFASGDEDHSKIIRINSDGSGYLPLTVGENDDFDPSWGPGTVAAHHRPTLVRFDPEEGESGNLITITGWDLSGATDVSFGGVAAQSYIVDADTQIRAWLGAGASGEVSVTTPYGTDSLKGFRFLEFEDTVTELTYSLDHDKGWLVFNAEVSAGTGTPTGTVTFSGYGEDRTVDLVDGKASVSTKPLDNGGYSITAEYSGDADYSPSTGMLDLFVADILQSGQGTAPVHLTGYTDVIYVTVSSVPNDELNDLPAGFTPQSVYVIDALGSETGTFTLDFYVADPANTMVYKIDPADPDNLILLDPVVGEGKLTLTLTPGDPVFAFGTYSQCWKLDSELIDEGIYQMEKSPGDDGQTLSVTVAEDEGIIWISDEAALTGVSFSDNEWTVKLTTPDEDWDEYCSVQVGQWDGDTFDAFNTVPATGTFEWGTITFTFSAPGTVSEGNYLALKVINSDGEDHVITTDGFSNLASPKDDPGFPLPELSVVILLGIGLTGLGGFLLLKKRNALRVK
jgi:hypothetical protein